VTVRLLIFGTFVCLWLFVVPPKVWFTELEWKLLAIVIYAGICAVLYICRKYQGRA
jgi:hypothetical protein